SQDWIEPLDDYMSDDFYDDFFDVSEELTDYEGETYGILKQVDIAGLYYNTEMLDEKDIDQPPETMNELLEYSDELDNDDHAGIVWQGNQYEGLSVNWFEWFHNFGGEMFSEGEIGEREVTLNDNDAAVKATEYL